MNAHNEKAVAYTKEILFVFNDLRQQTTQAQQRLGAQTPTWMPLQPGGSKTVRDRVLCSYANTNIVVCPLSQDLASNPKMLDIDHFYPKDVLMQTLNSIDKPLLTNIKLLLRGHFKNEYRTLSPRERAKQTADNYADNLANSLIPEGDDGVLQVTGLRNIYYNFQPNLWPLSGPTNSAKGKKESIKFSILAVLKSLTTTLPEPILTSAKRAFFEEFSLDYAAHANQVLIQQADALSTELIAKFEQQCGTQPSILPHYYEGDKFVSLLDYFKTTIIGKTAFSLAQKTANFSITAISIGQTIAAYSFSADPKIRSAAKALGIATHNLKRAGHKRLANESDTDSTQSGSTDTAEELKSYATDITKIKKHKVNPVEQEDKAKIAFHPGSSSPTHQKNPSIEHKKRLRNITKKQSSNNTMEVDTPAPVNRGGPRAGRTHH